MTNNDIQIMYSKLFPCCRWGKSDAYSSPGAMSNGQSTHHDRTISPYSVSDHNSLLPAVMIRAFKHDPTLSPDYMKVRSCSKMVLVTAAHSSFE